MAINYTIDDTDNLTGRDEFEQYKIGEKPQQIPIIHKITYDPLKIYSKYNKFPWEMLIHVCLVVVATTQVLLFVSSIGGYSRNDQNVFFKLFLSNKISMEEVQHPVLYKYFYTTSELKEHINQSFNTYFGLEESSSNFFENYEIVNTAVGNETAKPVVIMDLLYLPGAGVNRTSIQKIFSKEDYGVFNLTEENLLLKNMVYEVTKLRLVYHIRNKFPMGTVTHSEWYNWDVYQNFDFSDRNHFILTLQMDKTYWDDSIFGNFWARYIWLQIACILLALLLMFFNVFQITDITNSFNALKEKFNTYKQSVRITYKSRMKSLNQKSLKSSSKSSPKKKKFDKYEPVINFTDTSLSLAHSKYD